MNDQNQTSQSEDDLFDEAFDQACTDSEEFLAKFQGKGGIRRAALTTVVTVAAVVHAMACNRHGTDSPTAAQLAFEMEMLTALATNVGELHSVLKANAEEE